MESINLDKSPYYWRSFKINFRENSVDTKIIEHSFENDIFYSTIKEFRSTENMKIIDIGAHIGTFSLLSAIKFPNANIYSFEPFPETYKLLDRNINENKITQVHALNYAISNKDAELNLYLSSENWEHSTANTESTNSIIVKGKKLDSFINDYGIDLVDLVKFNCEGAEFEIIDSISAATFKKIKFMVILFHEDMVKGYKRNLIFDILKKNDFIFREINTSKNRGWIIAKNSNYYSKIDNDLIKLKYNLKILYFRQINKAKRLIKWLIKK